MATSWTTRAILFVLVVVISFCSVGCIDDSTYNTVGNECNNPSPVLEAGCAKNPMHEIQEFENWLTTPFADQ